MPYYNTETKQFNLSEKDILKLFKGTSFTEPFHAPEPYVFYHQSPQPEFNLVLQCVVEVTPELTTKGHYEQRWAVVDKFSDTSEKTKAELEAEAMAADQEAKAAASLQSAKQQRQHEVDLIQVTTAAGNTFDGNEEAQRRLTSAVTAMDEGDTLPWVLANNTVYIATRAELREALRLAGAAMAEIWVRPYQ